MRLGVKILYGLTGTCWVGGKVVVGVRVPGFHFIPLGKATFFEFNTQRCNFSDTQHGIAIWHL